MRAAALVALARTLCKSGQHNEANSVLAALAQLDRTPVDGVPAGVIALHERCKLLAAAKSPALPAEATVFYSGLQSSRWPLDRSTWEFYSEEARQWLTSPVSEPSEDRLALAEAAIELVGIARTDASGGGVRGIASRNRPLLLAWHADHGRAIALIGGPRWMASWLHFGANLGLRIAWYDDAGRVVAGPAIPPNEPYAAHSLHENGLPWTLRVSSADAGAELGPIATRRRFVLAAFGLGAALLLGAGWVVTRALAREFAVARLQSDFVAAVSHEFRSPLAAMRHLTGLLQEGVINSDARKAQYYTVLASETERLHRLVESLLDFRKMQAGRAQYNFTGLELEAFTECVASEFRNQLADPGRLSVEAVGSGLFVRADPDALSRALHNLLDNAAKYSPPDSPIRLTTSSEGGEARIAVEDAGPGIPENERKEIFRAFYRGSATKLSGVKGTGIGLASARQIVDAHGGRIVVAGAPGAGSRFEIVLPLERSEDGKHPGS